MPRLTDGGGTITTAEALQMKRASEAALAKRGLSSVRYVKKKKRTSGNALIVVARPGLVGVLEMFPAALRLNQSGYRVSLKCEKWLHDIFECVNYCEPDNGTHHFDKVFDPTRAWKTATTPQQKAWRQFVYHRFAEDFGTFATLIFSRLPNPRVTSGEYCFVFDEGKLNVGLRYIPWLVAHAKSWEFAEPMGSDVATLLVEATRGMK